MGEFFITRGLTEECLPSGYRWESSLSPVAGFNKLVKLTKLVKILVNPDFNQVWLNVCFKKLVNPSGLTKSG